MAARPRSGGTPATLALTRAGVSFTEHTYRHDPATSSYGMEAAEVLGLDPEQVLKTLLVTVDPATGSGRAALVVAIVPVSAQLDLKAVAAAVRGKKAVMAAPTDAERATGYVVGGISPVGQKKTHPTVLDESALGFEKVYVSGGRRGLDLGVAPGDLIKVTNATVAAIRR